MTQPERVLEYMQKRGSISQAEATQHLGVTRLSAIILVLKKAGYSILDKWVEGKNRWGEPTRYKRYWLA